VDDRYAAREWRPEHRIEPGLSWAPVFFLLDPVKMVERQRSNISGKGRWQKKAT